MHACTYTHIHTEYERGFFLYIAGWIIHGLCLTMMRTLCMPGRSNKKKNPRRAGKRGKIVVEFDVEARKEFLTGFRKRKTERRNIAMKKIQEKQEAARKHEKRQRREEMKALVAKLGLDKVSGRDGKRIVSQNFESTRVTASHH